MPLVLQGCLAYAAGLLTGLGGVAVPGGAFALLAAGVAGARRDARSGALALLALVSIVAGADARASDARCRVRLARAGWVLATLHDSAAPARAVPATIRRGACQRRALLLVRGGSAPAGAVIVVRGSIGVGARGATVRDAFLVGGALDHAWIPARRAAALATVDRLFGRDAALPRALLLADTRAIPAEVKDRFARSGLVHALSVSGLHVGLVALAVELLAQALRLPRRAAAAAALLVVAGYVLLLGLPAPAVRSALMLGMTSVSKLAQRPTSPWAGVAIGAWGPLLLDPRTVLDLGYQLSVGGVAALGGSATLLQRLPLDRLPWGGIGWLVRITRELVTSLVATVVTAPLVAAGIGQLSLVGVVSNLPAAPILALLQPILFLALALAPFGTLAAMVADAARPLLLALDGVAAAAAAVPGASFAVAPTMAVAAAAGVGTCAILVACASRHPWRPLAVALGALATAAWLPPLRPAAGRAELHLLDVGQGDAVALRTPAGRWVLFDAGGATRSSDAGRAIVVPYVRRHGGVVAALVLSHPHTDHVGGGASVVRALRPAEVWDPGYVGPSGAYRATLVAARLAGTRWRRVHPGDSLSVDGVTVRFLAPDSTWTAALHDPNSASTVATVEFGTVRFLLMGDAEEAEEQWLLQRAADLRADVLKVGHHGSRTSSSPAFLDAVAARVALVSVGSGNVYRHPSPEVLAAFAARGVQLLRTDELGHVIIRTDGRRLSVEANDDTWDVP